MPKVEITRFSGRTPTTTGQPRAGVSAINQSFGRSLQAAGEQLTEIGVDLSNKMKREREQSFLIDATVKASQQITSFRDNLQKTMDDPAGYADAFINEVDSIYSDLAANAPTGDVKNQFLVNAANNRISLYGAAFDYESKQTTEKALSTYQDSINSMSIDISRDPDKVSLYEKNIDDVIKSAKDILDPAAGMKFEKHAKRTIANSQIQGLTQADPSKAIGMLSSGVFDKVLSPEEIMKHQEGVITYVERVEAREKRIERQRSDEALTNYAIQKANGEALDVRTISNDANLTPEDKRQALRIVTSKARSEDDLEVYIEANERLSNGTLDLRWISENSPRLRPETTRSLVKDITSDISGNPAYKRSIKRIDTLFKKNPFSIVGALDSQEDEELKAEYIDDIRKTISEGGDVNTKLFSIVNEHKGRKLEVLKGATKKSIVRRLGGENNVTRESLTKYGREIRDKLKKGAISKSGGNDQLRAILELLEDIK